jgi:N-acetylmuramoyl-L-alanine amidase
MREMLSLYIKHKFNISNLRAMYLKFEDKTVMLIGLSLLFALLTTSLESSIPDLTFQLGAAPVYSLSTVVIDAGHGGKDPGCLGSQVKEKDIALKIALSLGKKIKRAFPLINVIYTRDKDVFIPLHERAKLANKVGADLFISIHCNYIGKRNKATGTETYIMGLHRADDNLAVAKRENSAILLEDDYTANYDGYDPESNEGHIILSMYQNAHLEQSAALAYAIEEKLTLQVKRKSRGVKQAGFLVLRNTAMPSVLIETGFLSTDDDETFLASASGQTSVAEGIFQAFAAYKENIEIHTVVETASAAHTKKANTSFYVQLAASGHQLDLNSDPWRVYENVEVKRENDYYKYLAGPFDSLVEANVAREKFDGDGFNGAFIVAYQGEARIHIEEVTSSVPH